MYVNVEVSTVLVGQYKMATDFKRYSARSKFIKASYGQKTFESSKIKKAFFGKLKNKNRYLVNISLRKLPQNCKSRFLQHIECNLGIYPDNGNNERCVRSVTDMSQADQKKFREH